MLPNPIISFNIGPLEFNVYMYGLMIAIGILCCFTLFLLYTKHTKFEEKFAKPPSCFERKPNDFY